MIHKGACHCGAVTFEVDVPDRVEVQECNCSICQKTGFVHLILPHSRFRLLSGADALTTYTFNTGVARHTFCKICGIKPFYTPRSNPDGIDINLRCLETLPASITTEKFDGANWEKHAHKLTHLSAEAE